jgi:SAM-dependent methyltransferase
VSAVYDHIGTTYARYRQPDPHIAAQIDRALDGARTVVNVGAGTGSYETGDHRYVAVEPSSLMISQRPAGAPPAVRAVADRLPFADGCFDAATGFNTIHHWPDAAAGVAELRRVTKGPIVFLTWESDHVARFWLTEEYIPEAADHDSTLVCAPEVAALLGPCRTEVVPVPHDCTDGFFAAYWRRPEMYLDPDARAAISGLALLPAAALERMVDRLRTDLESGAWQRRHADLLDLDSYDWGYRLVISA